MTPRKSRRKGKTRWLSRAAIVALLLLILGGLGWLYQDRLLDLALSSRGDQYVTERHLSPAEELENAIILGARELGVPHRRIGRYPGKDQFPRFEFRCPDRLHPISANRWLSRIFLDEGIEILDCLEEGKLSRPKLVYRLAAGPAREARATLLLYPPTGSAPMQAVRPRLAVIFDDFGHGITRVPRGILDLDCPLTISILPGRRASRRAEKEARQRGHAVFLHLPMEPKNYPEHDPGFGAVFTGMSADSIFQLVSSLRDDFKRLDGFNNHMGSRACTDKATVEAVLDWAEREELLLVDSWTTPRSLLYPLARQRDLPALRTDFFLDGENEDESGIMENIAVAAETARKRGWALVIGHPRPETLNALRKMMPRLRDNGIRFVTVPELFESLREADPAPPPPSG